MSWKRKINAKKLEMTNPLANLIVVLSYSFQSYILGCYC